jgi:hypothetical protein
MITHTVNDHDFKETLNYLLFKLYYNTIEGSAQHKSLKRAIMLLPSLEFKNINLIIDDTDIHNIKISIDSKSTFKIF